MHDAMNAYSMLNYHRSCSFCLTINEMGRSIVKILPSPQCLPKRDEQPGPPLSHKVTGSELLTLLAASTKT